MFQIFIGFGFGGADQNAIGQFRIIIAQRIAAENALGAQGAQHIIHRGADADHRFVEERRIEHPLDARHGKQFFQQGAGIGMRFQRDVFQSFRPQQRHVDGGGGHQQTLVGADVGSRLGAADMLLARLQGQRKTGLTIEIDRAADDAPGHLPHQRLARGHEAEIGAAGRHRHAQRLAVADGDIGALVFAARPTSGRLQQRQRQRIHHRNGQHVVRMRPVGQRIDRFQRAEEIGLRDDQRGILVGQRRHGFQRGQIGDAGGRSNGTLTSSMPWFFTVARVTAR
jgi:hypothetical protein